MADLPDEEVAARLPRLKVLPGLKPFDELRPVRLLRLRERGDVVAAGAGTNDAPPLRRGDVGLTMGGVTLVRGDLRGSPRPAP